MSCEMPRATQKIKANLSGWGGIYCKPPGRGIFLESIMCFCGADRMNLKCSRCLKPQRKGTMNVQPLSISFRIYQNSNCVSFTRKTLTEITSIIKILIQISTDQQNHEDTLGHLVSPTSVHVSLLKSKLERQVHFLARGPLSPSACNLLWDTLLWKNYSKVHVEWGP